MIEEGTHLDFKRCVLNEVWLWNLACGHVVVSAPEYQAEFRLFKAGRLRCRECGVDKMLSSEQDIDGEHDPFHDH